MEKYITKNGIKYELRGEQYYPMLEISEQTNYEIGKYGHLHLEFIKKHRRGTYTTLLTEGRLNEHLHNIDEQVHEQMESYITQEAERMGVTEELKASAPMHWVQMMNNIKASAEEALSDFCRKYDVKAQYPAAYNLLVFYYYESSSYFVDMAEAVNIRKAVVALKDATKSEDYLINSLLGLESMISTDSIHSRNNLKECFLWIRFHQILGKRLVTDFLKA